MQDLLVDCKPPMNKPIPIPNIQKRVLLSDNNINEQIKINDNKHIFIIFLGPYLSSKKANIREPIPAEIFKVIPNNIISLKLILNNVAA